MRSGIFLLLAMLVASPFPVMAESAALPGRLVPVADAALADVSVKMTITRKCKMEDAAVVQSKRPALDKAVVNVLASWCFRSRDDNDKPIEWRGVKYFAFSESAPDSLPVLMHSKSAISVPDAAALPSGDDEARNAFIEDSPVTPAQLPNQMWVLLSREMAEKTGDLVFEVGVVIDADGRVAALLPSDSYGHPQALADEAGAALFDNDVHFEPAVRAGQPVAAHVQIPLQFYALPDIKGLKPPKFPDDMLGYEGIVQITYVCDKLGNLHDIKVLGASHPKFQDAVIAAFANAKVKPAMRAGKPVAMRGGMRVHYETDFWGGTQPFEISGGRPASSQLPEGLQYDTPPKVKVAVDPVYPFELARKGVAGAARVDVLIDPSGDVLDVVVAEASAPDFGLALKAAMQEWTFDPARKDGTPTEALIKYERKFSTSRVADDPLDAASRRIVDELDDAPAKIVEMSALDSRIAPLYQAQPVYPRQKLKAGIGDDVVIDFYIDHDGVVRLPHATVFHDETLAWAAATAVLRWRFEKPLRNGKPVDVHARVKLQFEPPAPTDDTAKDQ